MNIVFIIIGALILALMGDFSILTILLLIAVCVGMVLLYAAFPGAVLIFSVLIILIMFVCAKD